MAVGLGQIRGVKQNVNPYIVDKEALKTELRETYKDILITIEGINEDAFYKNNKEKWSAAQNMAHLTLSAKVLSRALKAPKIALAFRFGLNSKKQRSLDWIRETYNNATFPAVTGFEPRMSSETSMVFEKEQFIRECKLNSV